MCNRGKPSLLGVIAQFSHNTNGFSNLKLQHALDIMKEISEHMCGIFCLQKTKPKLIRALGVYSLYHYARVGREGGRIAVFIP